VHGQGEMSDAFSILAATTPAKVLQPSLSVQANADYVLQFI